MWKTVRAIILTGTVISGAGAASVLAPAAYADDPICYSGLDTTYRNSAFSICTNRAHRIIIACNTQSVGTVYRYGPWANPGDRSQGWCPDDTYYIEYYGPDYPD